MSYQGHTGSANMLVIRLTNVHYEADEKAIEDFFQGYKILDQIRAMNPRTKTRSTVYVMLASVQDRISAVNNLNGGRICGRKVNVMPAHYGNYKINVTHDGFIRDDDATVTPEEPSPVSVNFTESEFPALGAKSTPRAKAALPMTFGANPAIAQGLQTSSVVQDTQESLDRRVLFITDIHPAATNDSVMDLLHAFSPVAIDRTKLGSNWMPSALVLMQSVDGRNRAVKELNRKTINGKKVVVQPFNKVSQDILARLTSPASAATSASTHSRNTSAVSIEPSSIAAILGTTTPASSPTHSSIHPVHQRHQHPNPQHTKPAPNPPRHAPTWLWDATPHSLHRRSTLLSGPRPAAPDTGFGEIPTSTSR
ncbi:hypothetical protein TW65_71771 [Stemphylium lycopersici]|nr:hypothetical protein TW65_71771 [Stemphylium lycopersici]